MPQDATRNPQPADLPPLPEGWQWVTLGEVAKINFREPFIRDLPDELEVTFLPMSAVDAGSGTIVAPQVKPLQKVKRGYTSFIEGDVLFAKITPSMENGKATIARGLKNGVGFGSTEFHVLRPRNNVLAEWLFYFIRQEKFRRDAKANFAGTAGQLRVPASFLPGYFIPLAPLPEQERIVARIEALFAHLERAVAALERTRRNLKRYRAAVLKAAVEGDLIKVRATGRSPRRRSPQLLARILAERRRRWEQAEWEKLVVKAKKKAAQARRKPGVRGRPARLSDIPAEEWEAIPEAEYARHLPKDDQWKRKYKEPAPPDTSSLPELPRGWVWATLEMVGEHRLGKMLDKAKNQGELRPYLRNINVRWFEFDLTDIQEMRVSDDELESVSVKYGDLVICEGGEPGRCAVWKHKEPMIIQKALHRVRLFSHIMPEFLAYCLAADASTGRLEKYFTGSTIKHFTGQSLKSYAFPLPPLDEQRRIVAEVERRLSVARRLEETVETNLRRLARLRQSILKAAFEGRLSERSASQ